MKAEELLRRYRQGERNFAGANLRGQSFKGQDLSEVDFSGADIRGANFSQATLIEANFFRAEAGLQRRWVVILILLAGLLAVAAGFTALINGTFVATLLQDEVYRNVGWPALIVNITFFWLLLHRGLTVYVAVSCAISVACAAASGGSGGFAFAGATALVFVGTIAGACAFAIAEVIAGAIAVVVVYAGAIAVIIVLAEVSTGFILDIVVGAAWGVKHVAVAGSIAVTSVSILISAYIGWRSLNGDSKYALIRPGAIVMSTWGGTSFREANLTNASFNQAHLKSVDLRKATLTRTSWLQTRLLDRVRPGTSFLDIPQIRILVQTGQGQGLDLTHLNLRGINLANAQLEDASFRAADLSEASLAGANLTRANLVQTQLDQTDLTGATLTGATIEDWGITGDTNLQGVCCDYIYIRWVKEGDPDPNPRRKPDNYEETFADGEFSDFIKPIVDTLDLYHNQNVDSRAIAIAFKLLAESHPEANLEIVAMEKRGQDKFLLKAKTAQQANHSQLSQQYFFDYNQIRSLSNQETQRLVAEKDDRIRSLENFVETALQRPNFYAENYQQRGDLMSEKIGVNINTRDGNVSGITGGDNSGVINLGEIQGDIHNAIQQLPNNPSQPNLKDLLNQLQTAIAEEPELDDTEKAAALAQVKKLAEAGQAPQDSRMKQLANKATGFLKGIAGSLTEGAKLVTAWDKVGPAIMSVFGLL